MEEQINQEESYRTPEISRREFLYKISLGAWGLGFLGVLGAAGHNFLLDKISEPESFRDYQNWEFELSMLENDEQGLVKDLESTYTDDAWGKELEKRAQIESELTETRNKWIPQLKKKMSKIESNLKFQEYIQSRKRNKFISRYINLPGMAFIIAGCIGIHKFGKRNTNTQNKEEVTN